MFKVIPILKCHGNGESGIRTIAFHLQLISTFIPVLLEAFIKAIYTASW